MTDKQHVSIAICGHVDAGKTFCRDTPIMLSDGTTKMSQDVRVGDYVMGDDFTSRKVIENHTGYGQMYRIIQLYDGDAITYNTNGPHVLCLKVKQYQYMFNDPAKGRFHVRWLQRHEKHKVMLKEKMFPYEKYNVDDVKLTANKFVDEIYEHPDHLSFTDLVEISTEEYCNLPTNLQRHLQGFKYQDKELVQYDIEVEKTNQDKYYGFEIDGNGRFLLSDGTVVHNSTTTGRLIFELGGIDQREMEKLQKEADVLGKSSFAFAFYMDRHEDERKRGVTIACTTKEFFTDSKHYTIIDAPGHRDFIKNMITGASQADVALLMVPADGNFTTSIAKGSHKEGEVQGQTRQHARLLNLLGVKQLIIGVNKMDSDTAKYSEERFIEIRDEMVSMLQRCGWKKDFVLNEVPIIPISGWKGDNLIKDSENMPWWKGYDAKVNGKDIHIKNLLDALDKLVYIPKRDAEAKLRVPISGVFKLKGVGDILTGRIEQGTAKPGDEVVFLPTHTEANPCTGKVFTVEMHHKSVESAGPGDNVGINVKGLLKANMPRNGDVMVLKKDTTLGRAKSFTAQVQVLDHPGELKVGYCPVGFVRTGHSACRLAKINWKIGKETGGQKVDDPVCIKANEMAEVVFEPQQQFVVDTFQNCEGLGRIAIMEGNGVVMLGKVVSTEKVEAVKK